MSTIFLPGFDIDALSTKGRSLLDATRAGSKVQRIANELVAIEPGRGSARLGENLSPVTYTTAGNLPSQRTALKGGLAR